MAPIDQKTPIFTVDESSDLPIWIQLRNRIQYLIYSGALGPDEQVPSARSVAASAKINYNTVTKAYHDLETSGIVVSIRGRGMYVNPEAIGSLSQKNDEGFSSADSVIREATRMYQALGLNAADIISRVSSIIREEADE